MNEYKITYEQRAPSRALTLPRHYVVNGKQQVH